jgi:hypothetical protein
MSELPRSTPAELVEFLREAAEEEQQLVDGIDLEDIVYYEAAEFLHQAMQLLETIASEGGSHAEKAKAILSRELRSDLGRVTIWGEIQRLKYR